LSGKVRASSLLEVLIAMIVIIIVFTIAMMIYTNVLRLSLSAKKLRAEALLQNIMLNDEHKVTDVKDTVNNNDFRIEQKITPYDQSSNLTVIHLIAYDSNQQKIAELQKVLINQ